MLNLANGASRCSAGTLTLSAWGGSGQEIRWYDSPGGTLLGTGPTYITPSLSANTTYYATSTATEAAVYGGPASPSIGNASYSGNNQHYLTFDVITPCTLKTVDVVAYQAGTRMVELRDANNVPLQSYTFSLPAGASTLTLNLALIPGTGYRLGLGSPTQTNLYRNYTGVNYPYTIGNNLVQITGSDAGTGNYYYYYNWLVEKTACTSAATPITATISTGAPVTVNSGTICSGDSLFLAAGGAGTYSWDNGASTYSLMVSPSTTTSYTVTGQSPGCAGTSTAIATVSVVAAPNVVMSAPSQVLCANALPMQLIGSPAGGSYSGPGLTADTFFPSTSLVGTQVLHYSYTNSEGCYDEDSLSVSVTPLPTVYLNAAVNYLCVNSSTIALSGIPAGGIYTGNGVSGNVFNPGLAGVGTHSISYTYTDGNSCSKTANLLMNVSACTGIDEVAGSNGLQLYPNPANNTIHFRTGNDWTTQLTIFNALGQEVLSHQFTSESSLDITSLAKGLYTCRFRQNNHDSYIRLVKD